MAKKTRSVGPVVDAARRAATTLATLDARFALVGGLAVSARAEPRYTRDVDLAVHVTNDSEAERIVSAMSTRGFQIEVVLEQRRLARLATARLVHRSAPDVLVDLLFACSGIEMEIVANAERLAYAPRMALPVARVGHLIAMKLLSESDERLQDRIDLRALAAVASEEDWSLATEAVALITKRGFHRRKKLSSALLALRTRAAAKDRARY